MIPRFEPPERSRAILDDPGRSLYNIPEWPANSKKIGNSGPDAFGLGPGSVRTFTILVRLDAIQEHTTQKVFPDSINGIVIETDKP